MDIWIIKWCTRAPYSTFGFVVFFFLVENKKEDEADSRLSLSIAIHLSDSLFLPSFFGLVVDRLIAYSLPPPCFSLAGSICPER